MTTNQPAPARAELAKSLEWLARGESFNVDDARRAMLDAAKMLRAAPLVAPAAERPVGDGWQPIETAPKDGTPILIFDPTQGGPGDAAWMVDGRSAPLLFDDRRFAIGYWRVWKNGGEWMWGNRNSSRVSPTHWMPLPSPPAASRPAPEPAASGEGE